MIKRRRIGKWAKRRGSVKEGEGEMTDRLKGFHVLLEEDIREDDAETIKNAILSLRHVAAVEPVVANPDDWMARQRVKLELSEKLMHVLYGDDCKTV